MRIEQWNEVLGDWFLSESEGQPVYLSATDAELLLLNEKRGLGLGDPAVDLADAVSRAGLHYGSRKNREWESSGQSDYPPWLPFLAASVLVVDRETERGTTSFYPPFSKFLGLRARLSQDEYTATVRRWWVALAGWLKEAESGQRGFPTWGDVSPTGHRSVIGHPYTQVLLRREDRKNLDLFLGQFDVEGFELPEVEDRDAAARHVVEALRRWARNRRSLTGRLRRIIEGGDEGVTQSLGYLLMAQMFNPRFQASDGSSRAIEVVPVFDEFVKELFFGLIAPGWVSEAHPLELEGCDGPVTQPDWEYRYDLEVTDTHLREGSQPPLGEEVSVSFEGSDTHVLVEGVGSWRGARRVEEGARVYLLTAPDASSRLTLEGEPFGRVRGLPEGWSIRGPVRFTAALARSSGAVSTAKEGRLIPTTRGGLALDRTGNFLLGGEPIVELPGIEDLVGVDTEFDTEFRDTKFHAPVNGELDLSTLGLPAGDHRVVAGPYRILFSSIAVEQPPSDEIRMGKNPAGQVVSASETTGAVLAGARVHPPTGINPAPKRLSPVTSRLVLFGAPGEVAEIEPTRAQWAEFLQLPRNATEAKVRSTYPYFDRVVKKPEWLAWEDDEGWVVALWGWGNDSDPHLEPDEWRQAVETIGDRPSVFKFPDQEAPETDLIDRWNNYAATGAVS